MIGFNDETPVESADVMIELGLRKLCELCVRKFDLALRKH
jgi:hypothetical protein